MSPAHCAFVIKPMAQFVAASARKAAAKEKAEIKSVVAAVHVASGLEMFWS